MRSILPVVFYRPFMFALLAALVAFAVTAPAAPVSAAAVTVTNLNDSGTGSLREAIAGTGDPIDFLASLSGVITLTSGQLLIERDVTINGPGATTMTIDGNASSLVFRINGGNTVSISGFTIANGKSTFGGAISNGAY